jgi:hypothetical protein
VTRREDAAPVVDALVSVTRDLVDVASGAGRFVTFAGPAWVGKTDADGRYSAENLDPGRMILDVVPIEECPERLILELGEGAALVRDVELAFGVIVNGFVRSAETREPIVGASVGSGTFVAKVVQTDAEGAYSLPGLPDLPVVPVVAGAPGYGSFEIDLEPRGEKILATDFELVRGRAARGRILRGDGSPIADARVGVFALLQDRGTLRRDSIATRTDGEGRFLLQGLRTDLLHTLVVRKERFATRIVSDIDGRSPAGPGGTIEIGDVELRPGESLAGSVENASGAPILGAWLELASLDPASTPGTERARSGSRGAFHFHDLAAGSYELRVFAPGRETEERQEIRLADGEVKSDVRIVVGRGRTIGGRVLDADGVGLEGAEVTLTRPGFDGSFTPSVVTRSGGRFQFTGLDPGSYSLVAGFYDAHGPAGERYQMVEARLPRVDAGTDDLVIRLAKSAEITGRVETAASDPVPYALVTAVGDGEIRLDGRLTDADGRFLLRVPADSTVELRAWTTAASQERGRPPTADETTYPQATQSRVRAGEREIVLVLLP